MLLATTILLALVILWQVIIKKDWISPNIFMGTIWFISTLFIWLNPYNVMKITDKSILIIILGLVFFFIGNIKFFKITYTFNGEKIFNISRFNEFNKPICYSLLSITFCFNSFMFLKVIALLKTGIPYSNIRDILFEYGEQTGLFKSSFVSTFYDWIIVPAVSILLIILIINLFVKKLPILFNMITLLNMILYVFSSSGRILMMHAVVLLFFCYKFFNIQIPKKTKKNIALIGISVIYLLLIMTYFRTKDSTAVSTLYSYFCIDIPLLSYWVEYIDNNDIMSFGNSFFRGILEGVNFLLGKLNLSTPLFWEMQEVYSLIQNSWIEVFPRNWYNAYVSCFFYFYFDFGLLGVILGSFIFGKLSSSLYNLLKKERNLLSIILYMIIIQVIIDSFMRWQLGTLTYIIILFFGILTIRAKKGE